MINISICLTDLPKSKITTSEKNGKKYINLVVDERREADNYGNTHTVYVSQSKEEREQKEKKEYVGTGKEFKFENRTQPAQSTGIVNPPNPIDDNTDDLPF